MTDSGKRQPYASVSAAIMLLVGMFVGLAVARFNWSVFTPSYTVKTYFADSAGLRVPGAVQLLGIPVGSITSIRPILSGPNKVEVLMKIAKKYQSNIRADSLAEIRSAGLLAGNYIEIGRGSPSQPVVPAGGTLSSVESPTIVQSDANPCSQLIKALSNATSVPKARKQ